MLPIINITGYRFTRLSNDFIKELQLQLRKETQDLGLKGSIILSEEGINVFLSGKRQAITGFEKLLNNFLCFNNMTFKESFSNFQPFHKILVKIKKEIIPFGIATIQPEIYTAPHVQPEILQKWLRERPDLVLLDTRNVFEIELGSFENALDLGLKHFRDFPQAVKKSLTINKNLPVVTFCTGGIRCEKASAFLLKTGFTEVYQLEGGILNYFEKCGGSHYKGDCFVFDERKALKPSLKVFSGQ
jgi:UPF0176 protein